MPCGMAVISASATAPGTSSMRMKTPKRWRPMTWPVMRVPTGRAATVAAQARRIASPAGPSGPKGHAYSFRDRSRLLREEDPDVHPL